MSKLPVLPLPKDVKAAGIALTSAEVQAFEEWDDSLSNAENTRIIDEKLAPYRAAHTVAMSKYDSNWHPV